MFFEDRIMNLIASRKSELARKRNFPSITVLIAFYILVFSSCDEKKNEETQPKAFFDLKGFIEGQVTMLNQSRPVVSKTMKMGDDSSHISSGDIDWKKELELFVQADINKPAYRLSYTSQITDSTLLIYTLKPEQDLPVRLLKIRLDKPDGKPVLIEALLKSENKLYMSEKNIRMVLEDKGGYSKVLSYQINGFQKLVTMNKKPFEVTVSVK